jgi:hypothetical protein
MKIQEHTDLIMTKLDVMDQKLDQHLERIAKVETRVEGHAGFIKASLALATALAAAIVAGLLKLFVGK